MSPERSYQLFEVSWEVCNKVGGIHTVLSSKAKTAVARMGEDYVAVGPLLLQSSGSPPPFDDEPGFEAFAESCREMGVPIRVGRWRITGRPRCILVGFSGLYEQKDGILAGLWERHKVDSIAGDWDYVEPVLFGVAAGMVIERWWEEFLAPFHRRTLVQAHEWMTGSALLYLAERNPAIGTLFHTHATMLGRALASIGIDAVNGLGDRKPEELAAEHGVRAKHSIEGVCARNADVFTTVSSITALEAERLHGRKVDVLLPNGLDLDVVDALARGDPAATRSDLATLASAFLGDDVRGCAFIGIAGRYEFHNKGIDLLLDALALMKDRPGRPVVAFVLVPAGNSGMRSELQERLKGVAGDGPIGISTHHLFDEGRDPVHAHCRKIGIDNRKGARVRVVQIPIYLKPDDGVLNREYEAVLAGLDLGVFPSFYEPWGYTPQEALAVGVPTITTDLAGFGRWAEAEGLGPGQGIFVVHRASVPYPRVVEELAQRLEEFLEQRRPAQELREQCRSAAGRTSWKDLFSHYERAYGMAEEAVSRRSSDGALQFRRARRVVESVAHSPRPRLVTFEVSASLPPELRPLQQLARNFWWSWNPGAKRLFEELGPGFVQCHENPIAFLQNLDLGTLRRASEDKAFLERLRAVNWRFERYLATPPDGFEDLSDEHPVAYFSAEFGVHPSLPVYSGGLGILAGDHLKSASDIGLPLIGVSLFYSHGYMGQRLGIDGQQSAVDRENVPRALALDLVRSPDGRPVEVTIPMPGRDVRLRAWLAMVGRVRLYMLDANVPENRPEDRDITRNLYGGDSENRIRQEIALGRGGVRLLREIGLEPAVYHMNEGHAAFLTLERTSRFVREEGLTFEAARECVARTTLFTTHTPVPAGHDRFGEDLMRRYFGDCEDWVGLPWEKFFALGQAGSSREFNMTYLAMSFAGYVNGVSKLHGIASRRLLSPFWSGLLESEVPVDSITNGVHLSTWTAPRLQALLRSADEPVRPSDFEKVESIDRAALWETRQAAKKAMIDVVRERLTKAFHERGDSPVQLGAMLAGLEQKALYIGFARRFAPYKRANLVFSDPSRLGAILSSKERPVRLVVAGKAHPRDQLGQEILKGIVQLSRTPEFIGRVVFVEDYDIAIARALVQGVDVWLNTPTRMEEASGTSGMKAAANGVLNLSIADGWWPEAADGRNGWVIAGGRVYEDPELQRQADATALYQLLEEEVVPAFFSRGADGLPETWLDMVVHCLKTVPARFSTDRMVSDYARKAYVPLARNAALLAEERWNPAKEAARDFQRVRNGFSGVRFVSTELSDLAEFKVGQHLDARCEVDLGSLRTEDVRVEMVVGRPLSEQDMADLVVVRLEPRGLVRGNVHAFEGGLRIEKAGHYAQGLRVRANVATSDPKGRGMTLWA
ncbi:MAG: hypothetical protein Fur0037_03710 [Planctomycetota bacterium]